MMTTLDYANPAPPKHATEVAPQLLILACVLAFEILVFSFIGTNFRSWDTFFLVPRLNVELARCSPPLSAM